jgi:hypothetical protein
MYRRGTNIWLALIETNVTALLFGCRVRFLSPRIMGDRNHVNNRLTLDYLMSSNQLREYNRSRSPWQIRFQLEKKEFPFALLPIVWRAQQTGRICSPPLSGLPILLYTAKTNPNNYYYTAQQSFFGSRASLDNTSRLLDCTVLVVYTSSSVYYLKFWTKFQTLRDG